MFENSYMACVGVLAWALPVSTAPSVEQSHIDGLSGDSGRGNLLYSRYCIGCHGREGDGMGENAAYLDPKPRDFTAGVFKCRSTPTGSLPLDSDLFTTIGRGIHASAMPSWIALMPQQRADLVAFIKTFSPRFQRQKPQAALPIPSETPNTKERAERCNNLY